MVDAALVDLDPVFDEMYAVGSRRSVPSEMLLKSMVLMAKYSITFRARTLRMSQTRHGLKLDMCSFFHNAHALIDAGVGPYFYLAARGDARRSARVTRARELFEVVALGDDYATFPTVPAYAHDV